MIWLWAAFLALWLSVWVGLSPHLAGHIGGWWKVVAAAGFVLSLAAFATVAGAW